METKKVTIQFEHKGSRALEESTIQTSLENIEKLFAECDSELGSMGMDGCGYVSQASQISELYEHIQDLKNYVWSAHQEVYDVLDHPLFLDFSNGVTQALSEIVLANFQTENTIGMEEYVDVTKQGHTITHKEVKKSLGFADFLGLSEIDPREGLPALENVETVSEFALLFRLDYDIMKEETDVNTAMQGFLTAGEFPHLSYDTETGYISGLLDFTIIVPLTEAITGYNQVTGEKLTGSERGWKVAGAVVDIISLGLGAKFLKAGGYAGKELLKKLGITFLQDTASGVGAYTVAYAASENGASGVDTFLISMLTGTVLSAVMGKPVFDEKVLKETPEVVGESTEAVIKGGLNSYADFSKAVSDIGKRTDLTDTQKVKELQNLFENSNYKTDINVPSDIQYVKGFDAKGNVIYDWPPKLGFDESTIKPISRTDGLPETWDRYGYMGGSNFADVPSTGKYTYSERAIPYVENEAAYHTGTFNNASYFDKIDAVKNGDIDTFNELLQNEGISKWDLDDFEELCDSYDSFISKANKELGDSVDVTYGIKGLAAEWGDMSGGAGQIVTPFGGDILEKIGILKEN